MNYYFSLQYSAIQKTVLRHDRLWSIAGISNILSRINEVDMPAIAGEHGGTAIVAGGGKLTARFPTAEAAQQAKIACITRVSTALPMLEFQVSDIYQGESFQKIPKKADQNPALEDLSAQKRRLRGYAVTFNPHLKLCEECGEYPAVEDVERWRNQKKKIKAYCRVCHAAFTESQAIFNENSAETTLQKVYHGYLRYVRDACGKEPAADFNDLFPPKELGKDDERKRMAVWFSDLNNMNDKVPVWLKQEDEDQVLETFSRFRETVIEILVKALADTFPAPTGTFLPFRLVVAGGDDLCLVMAEQDVLRFARNLAAACRCIHGSLTDDHPLSNAWLRENGDFGNTNPKPFGFGASFIISSIHTPFSKIHAVGEELMSKAKSETKRMGNSVNWRIMAEEEAITETLLDFDRPLFIETVETEGRPPSSSAQLTLADYHELCRDYRGISSSHRQQIIGFMIRYHKDPYEVERQMKLLDSSEQAKSFSELLSDRRFKVNGALAIERIATLFELLSIKGVYDE